jgi:hypothetical protein
MRHCQKNVRWRSTSVVCGVNLFCPGKESSGASARRLYAYQNGDSPKSPNSTTFPWFWHTGSVTFAESQPQRCRRFQTASWRWRICESHASPEFLRRLDSPHQLLKPPAQPIERTPPRTGAELVRLILPESPSRPLFLKHYKPAPLWTSLKNLFRQSRARRAFENALCLQSLRLRTAPPVAFGEHRRWLWLHEAFFICEEVPQAVTFHDYYATVTDLTQRRLLLRTLARQMAALHNAGFSHGDPNARNFMVSISDCHTLVLIDLDALRRQRFFTLRAAARDLRNMLRRSTLPVSGNLRFAVEYARARSPHLSARKVVQAIGS